jgi:actin-related protein 6
MEEWITRDVLEQTAFVSLDWTEMRAALRLPAGRRPYDREFVLPDFTTSFRGRVQLPPALQVEEENKEEEAEEEEDQDFVQTKDVDNDDGGDEDESNGSGSNDDDEDAEDEETPEQMRRRILRQRAEEERRRRDMEQEHQVLQVSVERFTVPEVLFRPSDAGLATEMAGISEAAVMTIEACPREFQPALYHTIQLVGGLAQIPGMKERLQRDIRALAPCAYDVNVSVLEQPIDRAWLGACQLSKDKPYSEWAVSREEWNASSSKKSVWKRLLASEGGNLV